VEDWRLISDVAEDEDEWCEPEDDSERSGSTMLGKNQRSGMAVGIKWYARVSI